MRYILDDNGYIEEVSFGSEITCKNKTCTLYEGAIPEGYNSLGEWADNANIRAYNIVDGNLTYDSTRDTELQEQWAREEANNNPKVAGDTLPIGSIIEWATDVIPTNWLLCNGQAVSRTIYAHLFKVIGTTYGVGDGNTTFNLPDYRGRVGVGKNSSDSDFNTLGKTIGTKEHSHLQTLGTNTSAIFGLPNDHGITPEKTLTGALTVVNMDTYVENHQNILLQSTFNESSLQPSIVTNYIIKAYQSAGVIAETENSLTSTSTTNALSAYMGKVLNESKVDFRYLGTGFNMNDITKPGQYGFYGNPTNSPTDQIAVLEVIKYSDDWIIQRVTVVDPSLITWERCFYSGNTWSEWVQSSSVYNNPSLKLDANKMIYVTPEHSAVSNYPAYGYTFYYKIGTRVHLHIGVKIDTTEWITMFTLPVGYRPISLIATQGVGSSTQNATGVQIDVVGRVQTANTSGYCCLDIEYDAGY